YDRYRKGGEHPLVCRKPRNGGKGHILLDGDALAKGKKFFDFGGATHSPDHKRMAWSYDDKGSEYFSIRVRDLASGKDLPDIVPDNDGDATWAADGKSFFYTLLDNNHRPYRVCRHVLGTPVAEDHVVLEDADPRWMMSISETQSGRYATIDLSGHDSSEAWLLDLTRPSAKPRLIEKRRKGHEYEAEHRGNLLYILTNADGTEDFKIVTAPLADPSRANWKDLVPHKRGRMITGMSIFQRHLVRSELQDGLPRIVVRDLRTGAEHSVAFDEETYDLDLDDVIEFDTDIIRFYYSSLTRPVEIYDYNMKTRERVLLKRREIPSGHDPSNYMSRRIFATSHDGAKVPVSILWAKDTPLDGSAPLLLQAYGAYGYAYEASFGAHRLSMVDRGFVFAIAHVRGGTDRGWRWYKDGKMAKKANTFHDFIAAAQCLCEDKYTSQGKIAAIGRSAGGLLIGVVANMVPKYFSCLIAGVPFVDTLNTMLDDTLPLTPPEWLEWGNPQRDVKAFETIRAYSPYDNIKRQKYPAILALGGLSDPRVTYWEPAKWVAKLRAKMSGGGPVLLKTDMTSGHGGSTGRFEQLSESAFEYAFILWQAGLTHREARSHGKRAGKAPAKKSAKRKPARKKTRKHA
ncbi:MAG: S9 family peptidase, partial [Alphaproteobacteria bacterium]|nr:S9 family peptidase [Alphaproteobacteria bacterium]